MKLRLPNKLQAALVAALASVSLTTLSSGTVAVATGAALLAGQQAQAWTYTTGTGQEEVLTTADYNKNGWQYDAATGMITGPEGAWSNFTFVLNNTALQDNTAQTRMLYVKSYSGATYKNEWGFTAGTNSTTATGLGAVWTGNMNWGNSNSFTKSQEDVNKWDTDGDGKITLTAKINGTGTTLWAGTEASGTALMDKSGLKDSANTIKSLTLNKDFIESFTARFTTADVTREDESVHHYSTPLIQESGRHDAIKTSAGYDAYIVKSGAEMWFASGGTTVEIAGDIYVNGKYSDGYGALRLGTQTNGVLKLNGGIYLGGNSEFSADAEGDNNRGTIQFNGEVVGEGYALKLTTPRNAGSNVLFNGAVTLGSFETAASVEFGAGSVANLGTVTFTTANRTFTNNGSITATGGTMNSIAGNGTLTKTGEGTLTINSAGISGGTVNVNEGTLAIGGGTATLQSLKVADTATLRLGNGTSVVMNIGSAGARKGVTLGKLELTGAAATLNTGTAWNDTFSIASLTSAEGGSTLNLRSNATVRDATVINLNGAGAFSGTVDLGLTAGAGSTRMLALNINENAGSALSGSVVNFGGNNNGNYSLGLGIHAESVTVKGITTGNNLASTHRYIFAGAAVSDTTDFANISDGEKHTLTINTGSGNDTVYSTDAWVAGNLSIVKEGTGTQRFTGDVTHFNGGITVNGGTLGFTNAVNAAGGLSGTGGALEVGGLLTVNNTADGGTSFAGNLTATGLTKSGTALNLGGSTAISGTTTVSGALANSGTMQLNDLTMAADATFTNTGSLTLGGAVVFGSSGIAVSGASATVTLNSANIFDLTNYDAAQNTFTLFTSTDGAAAVNLAADGLNYTAADNIRGLDVSGYVWHFNADGTITRELSKTMVWNGGDSGTWEYTSPSWKRQGSDDPVEFAEGSAAIFQNTAAVQVTDTVQADAVTVDNGAEVTLTEDGAGSLKVLSIDVAGTLNSNLTLDGMATGTFNVREGATWNIGANQAVKLGTNAGTINVTDVAAVLDVMSDSETAISLVKGMTNAGTVSLALGGEDNVLAMNAASDGTLEVRSGYLSYRSSLGTQTVKMGDGTTLLFGGNGLEGQTDDAVFNNNIVMEGAMDVHVYGQTYHKSATINGIVSGGGALSKSDVGDLTFTNIVEAGSISIGGGTTTFQAAVSVAAGSTLSLNDGTAVFQGTNAMTFRSISLTGSGSLSFAGLVTLTNNDYFTVTNGMIVAFDGGYDFTGTGGTYGYAAVINNGGTMKLGGTTDLSDKLIGPAAGGTLVVREGAVLTAKGIYNSATLTSNGTMNVEAGATVDVTGQLHMMTLNTAGEMTVAGTTDIGTLDLTGGSLTLQSNSSTIQTLLTVKSGANLIVTQGGALTINGSVTIDEGMVRTEGNGFVDADGIFTLDGNGFAATVTAGAYATVVTGDGAVVADHKRVTAGNTELYLDNQGIAFTGDFEYTPTATDTYTQKSGEVSLTDIPESDSLRLINLSEGATLNLTGAVVPEGMTIKVVAAPDTQPASISGGVTLSATAATLDIEQSATAAISGSASVDEKVRFSAGNGQTVDISNSPTAEQTAYALYNEDMTVQAPTVEMLATEGVVTVSNEIHAAVVKNDVVDFDESGTLVLEHASLPEITEVHAMTGGISITGLDAINDARLSTLEIGAGHEVSFYHTGELSLAEEREATVFVHGSLTADVGATLNANLVLGYALDDEEPLPAVLDVSAMHGLGGLSMGSDVTLMLGEVALSEDDLAAVRSLTRNQNYDLFSSVDQFSTNGVDFTREIGMADEWLDAAYVFSNIDETGRYYLFYSKAEDGGTIYIKGIPEPTTGTLSLLALCALAARRRRK